MAGKKRDIKPVSFSLVDAYERELYEYATDNARGKFGPYVKRLIERDRDGWVRQVSVSPVFQTQENRDTDEDSDAASGYL